MIEIATQLIVAFVLGILSTLLSIQIHRVFKTRSIKSAVRAALNDFATSWDAFTENQPPKVASFSLRSVTHTLKKVAYIGENVERRPETLSNAHLREALEIADEIGSIINPDKPVNPAFDPSEPSVSRNKIDALAKRAKRCAAKLGGWR